MSEWGGGGIGARVCVSELSVSKIICRSNFDSNECQSQNIFILQSDRLNGFGLSKYIFVFIRGGVSTITAVAAAAAAMMMVVMMIVDRCTI